MLGLHIRDASISSVRFIR